MAKPKEKVGQLSPAFLEKCSKEKGRLKKKLAKQLQMDLQRMLDEEIHTDLEFHLKGGHSVGHKLILKARVRSLWDRLCEGTAGDSAIFHLPHLDKSVFDDYIREVYTSDCADIPSEDLQVAMEGDAQAMEGAGRTIETNPCSNDLLGEQGASSGTDPFDRPDPNDQFGVYVGRVRDMNKQFRGVTLSSDCDRYSVDSLESGERTQVEKTGGVSVTPGMPDEQTEGAKGGNSQPEDGNFARGDNSDADGAYACAGPSRIDHMAYQGAYSLDMIPPTHFAAGQDFFGTDPSALFVLPNGQEINNNDANNNGVDANLPVVQNQNIPQVQTPRVVNIEPQLLDLVQRVQPPQNQQVPVALLADIQTQSQCGANGVLGCGRARATLPDLIKMSYCTTLPHDTCSVLGEDLLRVYLQEVDCDCTISVADQDFKCHRCILAARSSYFTAMLGGAWVESEADKITLEGVSPSAVEQALLYIYGGVVDVMETCSIDELVLLSDMYGLEGLKDIISFNIKMENCHFFHKPCAACISGVPEALVITASYGMEDLQERCIKWMNKNLTKVWPTKTFSLLPQERLDQCCQCAIQDLSSDTVLDVIMDCDKLTTSLPRLKWTEPVLNLVTRLMDSAMEYTSQHFTSVVSSERFTMLGKSMSWSISLLDSIFTSVIKSLPLDHICKTYLSLHGLSAHALREDCSWTEDFQNFVKALLGKCEDYVKLYIHQVIHTKDWDLLSKDMQNNLLEAASYVCIDTNRGKLPPKLSSMSKSGQRHQRLPPSRSGLPAKSPKSARNKTTASLGNTNTDKAHNNTARQRQVQIGHDGQKPENGQDKAGQKSNSRPGIRTVGVQSSKSNRPGSGSLKNENDKAVQNRVKDASKVVNRSVDKACHENEAQNKACNENLDEDKACDETVDEDKACNENDTEGKACIENKTENKACNENRAEEKSGQAVTRTTLLMKSKSTDSDEVPSAAASRAITSSLLSSSTSESAIPLRRRSGSTGDVPVPLTSVSRSRSEDLHLRSRVDNSVLQLVPIFETKFTLPSQQLTELYVEKF